MKKSYKPKQTREEMNKIAQDLNMEIESKKENPNLRTLEKEQFENLNKNLSCKPHQQNIRDRIPSIEDTRK